MKTQSGTGPYIKAIGITAIQFTNLSDRLDKNINPPAV
jgi:hypothetical protein